MEQFGEVLHGHFNGYDTLQYGNISNSEVEECILQHTKVGEHDLCKHMIILGSAELPSYIWSTFSAAVDSEGSSSGYHHTVYQDCTLENLHDVTQLLFFPFVSAEQCAEYLEHRENFCLEIRKEEVECAENTEYLLQPEIPGDLLSRLAGYCVSKTKTGAKGFLRVLVPETVEDYQGYCRSVISHLLKVIPVGLRKNISITTNPSIGDEKVFGILFQRDRETKTASCCVRLEGQFDDTFLNDNYLPDEINEFIAACVNSPELVEDCYLVMEKEKEKEGQLTDKCYGDYYAFYVLNSSDFNLELLKRMNALLLQGGECISNVIRKRITDMAEVEALYEQEDVFQKAVSISEVLQILVPYKELLGFLQEEGMNFSTDYTHKLLMTNKDDEAVKRYQELADFKDELVKYFGEQNIADIMEEAEKNRNWYMLHELNTRVLQNPGKETVEKAFQEAERLGTDFKELFGKQLSTAVFDAAKHNGLEEKTAYEIYLQLKANTQEIDKEYDDFCFTYFISDCKAKLEENFSSESLREMCRNMEENMPEWKERFIESCSEPLLKAFSESSLLEEEAKEVIKTIKESFSSDELLVQFTNIYLNIHRRKLREKIETKPKAEDIRNFFDLLERQKSNEIDIIVKEVYDCVSRKFIHLKNEECSQEYFWALCKEEIDLRNAVLEKAVIIEKQFPEEKERLDIAFQEWFEKILEVSLTEGFWVETVKKALEYGDEIRNFDDVQNMICKAVLRQFKDRCGSDREEIEWIYNILEEKGYLSKEVEKWYRNWQNEESNMAVYKRILKKIKSFGDYFYYCWNEKDVLDCIPQGRKEMCEILLEKMDAETVDFSSFEKGIHSGLPGNFYEIMTEDNIEKMSLCQEAFSTVYKKGMGIYLHKNEDLFELSGRIFAYKRFLDIYGADRIYFCNRKGEIIGEIEKDKIDNILDLIKKIQTNKKLNETDAELASEESEGLELLLSYGRLTEKNYRNLADSAIKDQLEPFIMEHYKEIIIKTGCILAGALCIALFMILAVCLMMVI